MAQFGCFVAIMAVFGPIGAILALLVPYWPIGTILALPVLSIHGYPL